MRNKEERCLIIYNYIKDFIKRNHKSPTIREIVDGTNIPLSTTAGYVDYLISEKKLIKEAGSRGISLYGRKPNMISIPIVGMVACGKPLFAEENIEDYFDANEDLFGKGDFFALRAKGDSMIDAGISDGDVVFIRKQSYANDNDIVVALIDDEATLKRFHKDTKINKIILHPENKTMSDIIVDNCIIQGVAVSVYKNIK